METSRDRMLKAINHIQPELVPTNILGFDPVDRWLERFQAADIFDLRAELGLDVQFARPVYIGPNAGLGLDIWGRSVSVMGATGAGYSSGRGGYPLTGATCVADIDKFPWPDPDDFDYQVVTEVLGNVPEHTARMARTVYSIQRPGQKRISAARGLGSWIPLLCTAFDLVGMEETLIRLHTEPALIEAVIAHLESFILGFERRLLDATCGLVDIFDFGDDFASQRGMLISPKQWRRFLKPTYAKIYGLAKSYGLKVWIHSCGTFRPVLPDMIDMGMDIWETVQVHLPGNDPQELKREFGDHLTFFGAINSQRTLPYGTPDDVRAEVKERIRVLGKRGGYICGPDHTLLADVPIENVLAMMDEARKV
jgi:uroporphyrinogen decarboxylase